MTLADKQAVTRALLRTGAGIDEMNAVRKHLSRIKGGRLARHADPAQAGDPRHFRRPGRRPRRDRLRSDGARPDHARRCARLVAKYKLDVAGERHARARRSGQRIARSPATRSSPAAAFEHRRAPGGRASAPPRRRSRRPAMTASSSATASKARRARWRAQHAARARDLRAQGRRAVILSGGELTVTIHGQGRGGPLPGICAGAGDRARRHGGGCGACRRYRRHRRRRWRGHDPAGAFVDGDTAAQARALGLDPAAFLADNDSTGFFAARRAFWSRADLHQCQ